MSRSEKKLTIVMVGPHPDAFGGISRVVSNWQRAGLQERVHLTYITTLIDVAPGFRWNKISNALGAWIKILKTVGPGVDLVHIHLSKNASLVRKFPIFLWSRLRGIPTVVHIHTGHLKKLYEEGNKLLRWVLWTVLTGCDSILVLSEEWESYVGALNTGTPVHIVRNGTFFPDPDEDFIKEPDPIYITAMGRLGETKGSYVLVPAFAALASDFPNVQLVMAGDGDLDKIRALAKSLGIEQRIETPGWLAGKAWDRTFRACDIYVLPSFFEGMPVSVLEAMAYGKPIVSTPVGGIQALVEEGVNGFLVPSGDPKQLEKKLRELLMDPDLRQRMGNESRSILSKRFDVHLIVDYLISVYQKVYAKSRVKTL